MAQKLDPKRVNRDFVALKSLFMNRLGRAKLIAVRTIALFAAAAVLGFFTLSPAGDAGVVDSICNSGMKLKHKTGIITLKE